MRVYYASLLRYYVVLRAEDMCLALYDDGVVVMWWRDAVVLCPIAKSKWYIERFDV